MVGVSVFAKIYKEENTGESIIQCIAMKMLYKLMRISRKHPDPDESSGAVWYAGSSHRFLWMVAVS